MPSPVPFIAGEKTSTSTAPSPPDDVGSEAMPTKSPGLMSSTEVLATPAIFQPGFIVSTAFGPSRVFTVSVDPSRPTIVPRTRTFSAACAGDRTAIASNATAALALPRAWGNFRFIFELSTLVDHNRVLRRPAKSTKTLRPGHPTLTGEARGLFGAAKDFAFFVMASNAPSYPQPRSGEG